MTEHQYNKRKSELRRRFRASIYVDVFPERTRDLERDRGEAEDIVREISSHIPNSYVGRAAAWHGMKLDREI